MFEQFLTGIVVPVAIILVAVGLQKFREYIQARKAKKDDGQARPGLDDAIADLGEVEEVDPYDPPVAPPAPSPPLQPRPPAPAQVIQKHMQEEVDGSAPDGHTVITIHPDGSVTERPRTPADPVLFGPAIRDERPLPADPADSYRDRQRDTPVPAGAKAAAHGCVAFPMSQAEVSQRLAVDGQRRQRVVREAEKIFREELLPQIREDAEKSIREIVKDPERRKTVLEKFPAPTAEESVEAFVKAAVAEVVAEAEAQFAGRDAGENVQELFERQYMQPGAAGKP